MKLEPPRREPRLLSLEELDGYCDFQWWRNLPPTLAHDLAYTAQNTIEKLNDAIEELQAISDTLEDS